MYKEYLQLLQVATADYDHSHIHVKGKRQVYQHDVMDDNYDSYEDDQLGYDPFDINTPVETIQAYASNFHSKQGKNDYNSCIRKPKDKWLCLDDKTKAIGIVSMINRSPSY
jgi:hypothetical protein